MSNKVKRPVFRLCNDSVFKELFSKVPSALILLVSDVLNLDYEAIKENTKVELASELHKTREKNKTTICDFIIKVGKYFSVNIEFNQSFYKGLHERNLLYVGRILSDIISKGTKYDSLPKYKVYQLNINTFRNFNGKILSKAMLLDYETGLPLTEALSLYNFDIAKCYNLYYNKVEIDKEMCSRVIKWGTILYTTDISSIDEIMGDDFMPKKDKEEFIKVAEELQEKHKTFTDDEIIQLTEWKMEGERMAAREQGLSEGRAEGRVEGRAIGRAEGHAVGHAEGMEQQKMETVKKMLNKKLDICLISDITGLSKEEIIRIKESI